ncbi:pentapeptide repeat-containing protein [Nostoc sp. PA-18-2419]|uniref:pentapeptide repeat-containing protein n=1 Tax=Nostoc sp. PA-18-2419 TaxID=2575443 RepID=UPI00398368E3
MQKRWTTLLLITLWLLSGICGCLSAFLGVVVGFIRSSIFTFQLGGWVALIVIIVFFIIIIYRGLNSTVVPIAVLFAFTFAVVVAIAFFIGGADSGNIDLSSDIGGIAVAFAVAEVVMIAISLAGPMALACSFILAGLLGGVGTGIFFFASAFIFEGSFAIAGVVVGTLLSAYIAWYAMKGSEKYAFIHNIAVAYAALKGTSFRNADLTDGSFREARLKSTDFRKTTLTRTCWRNAQLNCIRPGTTYLHNIQVQQLLVTGKGENQNYDRLDLRGINLYEANLENASFIDTDFYQANLQKANLSRSILVRTNFERSDIRGACLTGSCIQDWIISTGTKLDGIVCDYVYLKWIDEDKRDQMPPRGKFKKGGFVTFVKYILDTVELYHEKDINPRLALIVLQKMSKDYDEPLNVVAFGKRGDKVFIQVKVSERIIQDQFKENYYFRYDEDLKLWSGNTHQLPPAVNSFIEKRINEIASERTDDFVFIDVAYVEGNYTEISQRDTTVTGDRNINIRSGNYNERIEGDYIQGDKVNSMTNNPGGFSVGGSVGGNVNNVQGDGNRAVQGDNNQAVLGDDNQITQQNQVGADTGESLTREDVVKLLAQLETLIKGAELPTDTKEEVIEDLSAAKKATDKEEPNKQRALDRLTGVAETLEKTSKSVEAGQKIWTTAKPILVKIATWLGVAAGSHLLGL